MAVRKKKVTAKRKPTVGSMIDKLYSMRAHRMAEQKKVDVLKKAESELQHEIMQKLRDADMTKGGGKLASASITSTAEPAVKDWPKFFQYIARHKAWHLMVKRAAAPAYREELESRKGVLIPGVETFDRVKLNLTKAGS